MKQQSIKTALLGIAVALIVTGCVQKGPVIEFEKAEIYSNKELSCLQADGKPFTSGLKVGDGSVADLTGKNEKGTLGSTLITQGGAQMMVSALMQGGGHLVNRHNVDIIMWEKDRAVDKWLGDGTNYRKIKVGALIGSNYYVTGAITSLDVNTNSGGAELKINGIGGGYRYQEIVVGGDFVITDSRTSEIVFAEKYQIRLYSQEVEAGAFKIFGNDILNFGTGFVTSDPLQLSVRYMIDTAASDILRKIYSIDGNVCDIEPVDKTKTVTFEVTENDEEIVDETEDIRLTSGIDR